MPLCAACLLFIAYSQGGIGQAGCGNIRVRIRIHLPGKSGVKLERVPW